MSVQGDRYLDEGNCCLECTVASNYVGSVLNPESCKPTRMYEMYRDKILLPE